MAKGFPRNIELSCGHGSVSILYPCKTVKCGKCNVVTAVPVVEGDKYPKTVRARDVCNSIFGPGLFKLDGGRAVYDEVFLCDGGNALYLARVDMTDEGMKIVRRWIPWDTNVLQMYEVTD